MLHNEDHKASRLVAFCPELHAQLSDEAFADPKIWTEESTTVEEAIKRLKERIPKGKAVNTCAGTEYSPTINLGGASLLNLLCSFQRFPNFRLNFSVFPVLCELG